MVEQAANLVQLDMVEQQLELGLSDAPEQAVITGQGDLSYSMAECCQPVPGDLIVGVADDNDLVNVHRQDCLQALRADVYGRLMKLEWMHAASVTFPVMSRWRLTTGLDSYMTLLAS